MTPVLKTITIAYAPINNSRFCYLSAEFPITDHALLGCLEDPEAANRLLSAGRIFLGIGDDIPCVSSMYYPLPKRKGYTFEDFLFGLESQYRTARARLRRSRRNTTTVFTVPSVD